eukprot:Skav236404  [mRNA]  locus=scaffold1702:160390:164016:- [translate_table: standard]
MSPVKKTVWKKPRVSRGQHQGPGEAQLRTGSTSMRMPISDAIDAKEHVSPAFGKAPHQGAATPVEADAADSSSPSGKKEAVSVSSELSGLSFGSICNWLVTRLGSLVEWRCKTLPRGRIFPLPTSQPLLAGVFPSASSDELVVLVCLVMGLNSLNGEGVEGPDSVGPLQKQVLDFLFPQCQRVLQWEAAAMDVSWDEFFRCRGIDYKGEEVQTAQYVQWENLLPALPQEVGGVELESVVEFGCLHYVKNFREYLVPEEDQVFVKPPKVMVRDEHWSQVARGLLEKGICRVMAEDDVHRVRGRLLLNGLFGVSKSEFEGGFEVRRLIMNLIPLNRICRSFDGDIATLPSWAGMSALQLHPTEDLVVSSEDVRCFFYIFRVPLEWHPYLCFNKELPRELCPSGTGRFYLCSTVLPMGFKNSVSLAQHVHRVIVRKSLSRSLGSLGGESEIRKDRHFPSSSGMFRIYLDNFDELRKVNRSVAEAIEGRTSPLVFGLREEYLSQGVPRHPKKAVSQSRHAEVQGAVINGELGIASPKPDKVLRYCQLAVKLLQSTACTQKQLQVVAGGFVYLCMFRRPLLGALNHIWLAISAFEGQPPVVKFTIPHLVKMEISRFLCLVPLAFVNFRTPLVEQVTASDASEYGGGVTFSTSLTEFGVSASRCLVRGDVVEPAEVHHVLSIGLFDGIAALRVAIDCLDWVSIGHISVESNSAAARVVESRFPASQHFPDVTAIDAEVVKGWACKYSQASVVLLGAGPPCQGVSGLNWDRKGALKDARSGLFVHVPRVRQLLKQAFPWARVVSLMESVSSMDSQDLAVMSDSYGDHPYLIDASHFSLSRRPRFYWVDWELLPEEGVTFTASQQPDRQFTTVECEAQLVEDEYITPGWKKVSSCKFPTFTTSRQSQTPVRRPAGLSKCQPHEIERWRSDLHRFPPYQYVDDNCLKNKHGEFRVPNVPERECILGFPLNYTMHCMAKKHHGTADHEACRYTLLGNSWSVPVITWLLGHLGTILGFHPAVTVQDAVQRCAPGAGEKLAMFLQRPRMRSSSMHLKASPMAGLNLVNKIAPMVSLKGEDLLLQADTEDPVKFHRLRASLPSRLWKWSTAASWRWTGNKEHINVLEMRAAFCALRWRLEKQRQTQVKFVHMVDSLVVLHALSRGRSSSKKLRRVLLRVNALILATGVQVVWSYVHTSQNPADRPSRRPVRKKWKNAKKSS